MYAYVYWDSCIFSLTHILLAQEQLYNCSDLLRTPSDDPKNSKIYTEFEINNRSEP